MSIDKSEIIYELLKLIPKGKVSTYGAMAKASGISNPRLVGSILHKNENPKSVPCYKVVNAHGRLAANYAFGGAKAQRSLLKNDSVPLLNGQVAIAKCFWEPSDRDFHVLTVILGKKGINKRGWSRRAESNG